MPEQSRSADVFSFTVADEAPIARRCGDSALERYFGKEGTEAFLNYQRMIDMQPRALCA